jgi:small subunit ribosomal protein S13
MKSFKQSKLLHFSQLKGIPKKKIKTLCVNKGSNPNNRFLKLKNLYFTSISKQVTSGFNFNQIKKKIKFFWQIKLYRGIKHMLKLPVHGQRTKTNSKTKRKFNFFK